MNGFVIEGILAEGNGIRETAKKQRNTTHIWKTARKSGLIFIK
jgi:hypothetical protein